MVSFSQGEKRFYASSPAKYTVNLREPKKVDFEMPHIGEKIRINERKIRIRDGQELMFNIGDFAVSQITEHLVCCINLDSPVMCKVSFSIVDFRVGIYSYKIIEHSRETINQELAM